MIFGEIEISEDILSLAREIFSAFSKLNSTEIWTTETAKSTIKQIQFYWDAGFFNSIEDANKVLRMNVQLFPESANVYDSYGESFMLLGKKEDAIKYFEMAIANQMPKC